MMTRDRDTEDAEQDDSQAEHVDLFYLSLIRRIVDKQKEFMGEKTALKQARRAPLHIDKDGNVSAYYGQGSDVLDILTTQYEQLLGEDVARSKIKAVVRQTVPPDKMDWLPERIRVSEQASEETTRSSAVFDRLRRVFERWT